MLDVIFGHGGRNGGPPTIKRVGPFRLSVTLTPTDGEGADPWVYDQNLTADGDLIARHNRIGNWWEDEDTAHIWDTIQVVFGLGPLTDEPQDRG